MALGNAIVPLVMYEILRGIDLIEHIDTEEYQDNGFKDFSDYFGWINRS